jgi:single-stranded DNA-binding protein
VLGKQPLPDTAGRGQAGRRSGQGSRAIVTGKLRQRSYETKEGEKRTV